MRHSPVDVGVSAAEVIARRLPVMWWGMINPTAAAQAEMMKMVVEKQMAFAEACFAVQVEMFRMLMMPWRRPAPRRIAEAALAPAARRVKANARRLRR
jgi:hypothetical protein